jgi:hypothetical protein
MDCEQPLQRWPAVVVHGLAEAMAVLRWARPVCLLSARGAAGAGGVLWWRALIAEARATAPDTEAIDVLDCAAAPGLAMAALRAGQRTLVLAPEAAAWARVQAAAAAQGATLLARRPPALDLASPGAARRLGPHLTGHTPS